MLKVRQTKSRSLKSFVISLVLFGLIFTSGLSILMRPQEVSAQAGKAATAVGPGFPVTETGSVPNAVNSIWDTILGILETIGKVLYKNALDYFLQRVAYDTATFLATGDKGQKPLYWEEGVGGYLAGIASEAVGGALDDMAKDTFGVSLCEPYSPTIKLNLILSAKKVFEPKRAVCTFDDILKNKLIRITDAGNRDIDLSALSQDDFSQFANYFRPESNELGISFQLQSNIKVRQAKDTEIAKLERELEPEIQSLKSTIGELGFQDIKTPALSLKLWSQGVTSKTVEGSLFTITGDVVADAIGTFVNTLTSKYLDKLKKGLLAGKGGQTGGGPGDYSTGSSFATRGAEAQYADFIIPSFRGGGQIEILGQLSSCSPNPKARLYNNCIIDNNLATAIDQKLTVREAIDRGYLNLNKPFGFFSDGSEPDYNNGYSYRSLVFLRKYRIIPVTWELAALYIKDISTESKTYSLSDVMGSPENDFAVFNSTSSPFYHLIDPNWVLKIPEYECRVEGPGPQVLERVNQDIEIPDGLGGFVNDKIEIIQRANYCADERSCIVENSDGSCLQYGYCTKERSVWGFNGDSCQPNLASCETYVNSNNQKNSYLANTLDACDSSQVGCRWYSLYKTASGEWAEDIWNEASGILGSDGLITFGDVFNRSDYGNVDYARHFNNQIAKCNSSDAGCQQFLELTNISPPSGYDASAESIYQYVQANAALYTEATYWSSYGEWGQINEKYLKQAPLNLNCPTDITDPNRDSQCDNYAQSCTATDVGCLLYTPVNGDPPVPAVVQPNDYCSEQCVGYDQYLEQPTYFELLADPAASGIVTDLIPDTANSCRAQAVGCERFTNLDTVEQGGEGIEYYTYLRECISPNDPSAKVFYTWEGSDTTGYQLKTWRLQASGGPVGDSCTPAPDNLACRTFIDASGSTWDRDINTVVFATEDCHPLRRELDGSIVYGIESLSNTCRAADVGCHEYRGNSGNVVTIVTNDDFETGTSEGWSGGTNSNESVYVGGHSLATGGNQILKRVDSLVQKNKAYTLSFWARGNGSGSLSWEIQAYEDNSAVKADSLFDIVKTAQAQVSYDLLNPIAGTAISFGGVSVGTDWQYYQVGPLYFDRDVYPYEFLQTNATDVYLDNIILREITDSYYLIKDSWVTPPECDQPFPGAQLGCQSYHEQSGDIINLLGFSSLCSDSVVGCKALIATQNSSSPYGESYNTENNATLDPLGLDDANVPADSLVYLVDNPDKYCQAEVAGCKLMGQAFVDQQTNSVAGFGDTYIVDNPNKYQSTLCQAENLYCEQYQNDRTGATAYFIDPGQRLCEYKAGGSGSSWYQTGTDIPCDLNYVCSDDMFTSCTPDTAPTDCGSSGVCIPTEPNQPAHNDNFYYDGWVGSCNEAANGCSQYIDPEGEKFCTNDQGLSCTVDSDCAPAGVCRPHLTKQSYYYLEQSLDAAFCNGVVDRELGCRLFNKTDAIPPAYSSYAWPSSLTEDGQTPVSAADPALNDSNIILKVQKDRTCDEWLYCRTRIESYDSEGNRDDKCFDIGLCDALDTNGECIGFASLATTTTGNVAEVTGEQINGATGYSSPYSVEDLRTISGLTKAGMSWSGYSTGDGEIPGYWPYGAMQQIGNQANVLKNSGFENTQTPNTFLDSPFISWSSTGSTCATGGTCSITASNQSVDGLYAAHLSAESTSGSSNLSLSQNMLLSPSQYVLSGYVRWEGINTGGGGVTIAGTSFDFTGEYSDGWQRFVLLFNNSSNNVTLSLFLNGVQSADAYFDGLEILPALQATNAPNEVLLGQTCRMYPKQDSPECNYTKSGKSYAGWPGFCVETDPRNPAYCVNWWPVDVIKGSVSQISEEPLNFSEKVPLYYCVEVPDDPHTMAAPRYGAYTNEGNKCDKFEFNPDGWNIGSCNKNPWDTGDEKLFSGLYASYDDYWPPNPNARGIKVTLPPESPDYDLKTWEIEKIKVTRNPGNAWGWPDFEISYLDRQEPSPRPGKIVWHYNNNVGVGNQNIFYFDIIFNAETDGLEGYALLTDDYTGSGNEGVTYTITYYLRQPCTSIVKVAEVDESGNIIAVPYWSRLNPLSGYQLSLPGATPNQYYSYNTDSSPFGSTYQSGLANYVQSGSTVLQDENDPSTWDSRPEESGNQPLYVEAENTATINDATTNYGPNIRAGTPYACLGSCDSSVCVGGPKNGQACNTNETAKACFVGDGVSTGICIGSWQASPNVNGQNSDYGKLRLQDIFAQSLAGWTWGYNSTSGRWEYQPNSSLVWNIKGTGTLPEVGNIKINDEPSPYVLSSAGTVKLTFTSNINNNQLPLREYRVTWGDGSPATVVQGYFDERTSPGDPHVLYHTYDATGKYLISITVKDNWDQVGTSTAEIIPYL